MNLKLELISKLGVVKVTICAFILDSADMIDISTSSEYPAIVYDGIQVNAGLLLFTKNQQFMLTTDSDILSPLTAKINAVSSYNFNFNSLFYYFF